MNYLNEERSMDGWLCKEKGKRGCGGGGQAMMGGGDDGGRVLEEGGWRGKKDE